MLARLCGCSVPQVFEDSETCNTCGRTARILVTASTWRLALAIAQAAVDPQGLRRTPDAAATLGLDVRAVVAGNPRA